MCVLSHKNIGVNQSVFGSYLWVPFSQNEFAGSYFAVFLFAGFYCNAVYNLLNILS